MTRTLFDQVTIANVFDNAMRMKVDTFYIDLLRTIVEERV